MTILLKSYWFRLYPTKARREYLTTPFFRRRHQVRDGSEDERWIPAKNKVGIDLGLEHFAILTNDEGVSEKIPNPRFLRKSEEKIKKAQRSLSRKKIGSKNREKARIILSKRHEKIKNKRTDFLHQTSRRIVDENQVIVVETLRSKNMMKKPPFGEVRRRRELVRVRPTAGI